MALYLNLTQCYLKLENIEQAQRNVGEALLLDPNNSKALYRRALIHEKKGEIDVALAEMKRALKAAPGDAAIEAAINRLKAGVSQQKAKEKKLWGKIFG